MNKKLLTALYIILFVLPVLVTAQTPYLVKDINPGTPSSNTELTGIMYNSQYVFRATTAAEGIELWITDGTTAGTFLLKDINPGSGDSYPQYFFIFNNVVYFSAYTTANGTELWRTDGTNAGTTLVKDIYTGSNSAFVDYNGFFSIPLVNVWENNGSFYFKANNNNSSNLNNIELWKSDGTTSGTVMVKDINTGVDGSFPQDFLVFNNNLFFIAYTNNEGLELWKTDGSTGGTVLVKDIYPGSLSAFVDYNGNFAINLVKVWENNGSFYFKANNNNSSNLNNVELWKTDGSVAGTVMVKDINNGIDGSFPQDFLVFNNTLFFIAYTNNEGMELWKTDGSTAGTVLVKDIYAGSLSAFVDYNGFFQIHLSSVWENNGSFYFIANNNNSSNLNNVELWKTDGTTGGTVMVKDINNGIDGSFPQDFLVFNNNLFFIAYTNSEGLELWKSDGSAAGTVLVKDIYPGSNSAFVDYNGNYQIHLLKVWENNGSFYFTANNNNSSNLNNVELWKTDGTTNGTVMVKDINNGIDGSFPQNFMVFNNNLFFKAYTNTEGSELWKTDGSVAGTQLVKDIRPGNGSGLDNTVYNIIGYNNSFYFTAFELGASDNELWKTDGTTAGTTKVLDIYSGTDGSYPISFTLLPNDNLIFLARDAAHGRELWSMNLPGVTGVPEPIVAGFSVYPNPARSNETITVWSHGLLKENIEYHCYDLTGKEEFSGKIKANPTAAEFSIPLPDLAPGIYLLRLGDKTSVVETVRISVMGTHFK